MGYSQINLIERIREKGEEEEREGEREGKERDGGRGKESPAGSLRFRCNRSEVRQRCLHF